MEKGEESIFCWNRNERNDSRIEICVLETSFKNLEGNVEDTHKTEVIIKHSFYICWSFKAVEKLVPEQELQIRDLGKKRE